MSTWKHALTLSEKLAFKTATMLDIVRHQHANCNVSHQKKLIATHLAMLMALTHFRRRSRVLAVNRNEDCDPFFSRNDMADCTVD